MEINMEYTDEELKILVEKYKIRKKRYETKKLIVGILLFPIVFTGPFFYMFLVSLMLQF